MEGRGGVDAVAAGVCAAGETIRLPDGWGCNSAVEDGGVCQSPDAGERWSTDDEDRGSTGGGACRVIGGGTCTLTDEGFCRLTDDADCRLTDDADCGSGDDGVCAFRDDWALGLTNDMVCHLPGKRLQPAGTVSSGRTNATARHVIRTQRLSR